MYKGLVMKYFHLDTETDGLNVEGQPSDHPDQPNMVSISISLDDEDGGMFEEYSTLIKPVRPISPELVAIHGITTERAEAEGVPLAEAMEMVASMLAQADIVSAFNAFFDVKMIKVGCAKLEARGEEIRQLLETKSSICTMAAAAKFLKAGRYIKLADAHERIIGDAITTAHDADADLAAHRRLFYQLRAVGALPEPKSLERRVYAKPPPPR